MARIATLTERERDVIALVGEGLKNKQIGSRLSITETTVGHHLTSIFAKLGVESRLEMVLSSPITATLQARLARLGDPRYQNLP